MNNITMEQIARKAGISRTTVSKVLNNRPIIVSKKTREKINGIVQQLGYRPNYFAKSLKEGKTRCIGLMGSLAIPDFNHPYVSNLAASIEDSLVQRSDDYSLNIFGTKYTETYEKSLELIQKGLVEGLLIIIATVDIQKFEERMKPILIGYRIPFVVMHSLSGRQSYNNVGVDSVYGGYLAGKHLACLGHRDIWYYDIYGYAPHFKEIFQGFTRALADSGQPFDPAKVIAHARHARTADNYTMAYNTGRELKNIPRALFVPSDVAAIGILRAFQKRGIRVPEEAALVAYNEAKPNMVFKEELTAVYHPIDQKARAAVRMLLDILEGEKSRDKIYNKTVKPWLEVGETCGGRTGSPMTENQGPNKGIPDNKSTLSVKRGEHG